jgi:hypothetical protein
MSRQLETRSAKRSGMGYIAITVYTPATNFCLNSATISLCTVPPFSAQLTPFISSAPRTSNTTSATATLMRG